MGDDVGGVRWVFDCAPERRTRRTLPQAGLLTGLGEKVNKSLTSLDKLCPAPPGRSSPRSPLEALSLFPTANILYFLANVVVHADCMLSER